MSDESIMTKSEFVRQLVKSVLPPKPSDDDVLACMIVLHTFCMKVAVDVSLVDAESERLLSPLTRRHCAETVAEAMLENSGPRSHSDYWYALYDQRTPYEVAADIEGDWKVNIKHLIESMKATGLVSELVED